MLLTENVPVGQNTNNTSSTRHEVVKRYTPPHPPPGSVIMRGHTSNVQSWHLVGENLRRGRRVRGFRLLLTCEHPLSLISIYYHFNELLKVLKHELCGVALTPHLRHGFLQDTCGVRDYKANSLQLEASATL